MKYYEDGKFDTYALKRLLLCKFCTKEEKNLKMLKFEQKQQDWSLVAKSDTKTWKWHLLWKFCLKFEQKTRKELKLLKILQGSIWDSSILGSHRIIYVGWTRLPGQVLLRYIIICHFPNAVWFHITTISV